MGYHTCLLAYRNWHRMRCFLNVFAILNRGQASSLSPVPVELETMISATSLVEQGYLWYGGRGWLLGLTQVIQH